MSTRHAKAAWRLQTILFPWARTKSARFGVCAILAASLLAVSFAEASAEPVECTAPTGEDELAICKSEDLRAMDGELDRAYRAARVRWTASMSNSVKVMHDEWLKERRKCGSDDKCLMDRMVEQIRALDAMRPESPSWILDRNTSSK